MSLYLYAKALHLIGLVAWFAGLFYIFRLYAYHTENQDKDAVCAVFTVMERKLYRIIMTPAMIFTLAVGGFLIILNPAVLRASWFYVKLVFLLILFIYHFYAGHVRSQLACKNFILTGKQCRLLNEVPTVVLIAVVLLAILKP